MFFSPGRYRRTITSSGMRCPPWATRLATRLSASLADGSQRKIRSSVSGVSAPDKSRMRSPGAGRLKCKAFLRPRLIQSGSLDHEPAGGTRAAFGIEGRQSARNLVGVHKRRVDAQLFRELSVAAAGLSPAPLGPPIMTTSLSVGCHGIYAARSATTASSTGKPDCVTRSRPSGVSSTAPSSRRMAMRRSSIGRPASCS